MTKASPRSNHAEVDMLSEYCVIPTVSVLDWWTLFWDIILAPRWRDDHARFSERFFGGWDQLLFELSNRRWDWQVLGGRDPWEKDPKASLYFGLLGTNNTGTTVSTSRPSCYSFYGVGHSPGRVIVRIPSPSAHVCHILSQTASPTRIFISSIVHLSSVGRILGRNLHQLNLPWLSL